MAHRANDENKKARCICTHLGLYHLKSAFGYIRECNVAVGTGNCACREFTPKVENGEKEGGATS